MSDGRDEERVALLAPMSSKQLLGAGFIGLMIGLITWGIGALVDQYVLKVLFCQGDSCGDTAMYANAIASAIGAGLGLFGLIKLRVLRPLLVVAAGMAALWNLPLLLSELPLYGIVAVSALLSAVLYMLFTWLARLRAMYLVLVLFVVIVVALRFALTS